MKKIKLFSTLSTALLTVTAVPIVATACTNSKKNTNYNAIFKKEYFDQSSTVYNPSLATFSAYTTYRSETYIIDDDYSQGDKNIKEFLTNYGFENFESNSYYKTLPGKTTEGVAIATMPISDNYTLIALVPRSWNYVNEWCGNMMLEAQGRPYPKKYHAGFYVGAVNMLLFLKDYILRHNLTGNIKIWIPGYSRGAAVSNLCASIIDEAIEQGKLEEVIGNTTLTHENLFCYTFATPTNVDVSYYEGIDIHGDTYNNIFNVINPCDAIPYLFPFNMQMDRFGKDKYIWASWIAPEQYKKYVPEVITDYKDDFDKTYTIDDWTYYSQPGTSSISTLFKNYNMEFATRYATQLLGEVAKNRQNYVNLFQGRLVHLFEDIYSRGELIPTAEDLMDILTLFYEKSDDDIRLYISFYTLIRNFPALYDAHIIYNYIGWLKTCDPNYHNSDYELNTLLDDYKYYKIETKGFNNVEIWDATKENKLASFNQNYHYFPWTTDHSDNIAIGGFWNQLTPNNVITYVQSFLRGFDINDIHIKYRAIISSQITPIENASITLYEVTPKKNEVVKEYKLTTLDHSTEWAWLGEE